MDDAFWKDYKGLLALDTEGRVFFTKKGRSVYATRFHQFGFRLAEVTTLEQFREIEARIAQQERHQHECALRGQLADPQTSDEEKRYLRRILGVPEESASARVFDLSPVRARRLGSGRS